MRGVVAGLRLPDAHAHPQDDAEHAHVMAGLGAACVAVMGVKEEDWPNVERLQVLICLLVHVHDRPMMVHNVHEGLTLKKGTRRCETLICHLCRRSSRHQRSSRASACTPGSPGSTRPSTTGSAAAVKMR